MNSYNHDRKQFARYKVNNMYRLCGRVMSIFDIRDRIGQAHAAIKLSDLVTADALYGQAVALAEDAQDVNILILVLLDYSVFCLESGRENDSARLRARIADLRKSPKKS